MLIYDKKLQLNNCNICYLFEFLKCLVCFSPHFTVQLPYTIIIILLGDIINYFFSVIFQMSNKIDGTQADFQSTFHV